MHRVLDKDCGDFPSQRAAQIFFLNNSPAADPHRLDADGDRVVCESLPCPCYFGTQPPSQTPTTAPVKPAKIKVVRVLTGELVKVQEGTKRPYTVHLQGLEVDEADSCFWRGAKQDLQTWIKPGRVVRIAPTKADKKRDPDGHTMLNLLTDNADQSIGGAQIATGWGRVATYSFGEKRRYSRWERQAQATLDGYWGDCVPNSGSAQHPIASGTAFEFAGLRYQFALSDPDAWPEMQAENKAGADISYTATAPPAGWSFVRVQVTVINLTYESKTPSFTHFDYWRGTDSYNQFANVSGGTMSSLAYWCGTGASYVGHSDAPALFHGESVTGWVCATVPAPMQPGDTWRVQPEYDQARFVRVG